MYIAHFEVSKREPQLLYFTAHKREAKKVEFIAEVKEPIKFVISKDKHLEVQ